MASPACPRARPRIQAGQFAEAAIGYVHIDISELRLAEGKLNMFLAIDRISKFTYVEFRDDAGKMNGADFLRCVVEAFPYAIHTVLTDNGMAFADLPKNRNGPSRRYLGAHIFDRVCDENGIEHKLTKPYHPWTNGQAERMNRTVKEATIKVVPLSRPGKPQSPRPCFRVSLQFRQAPQGAQVEDTVRSCLPRLDDNPRNLQT